MATFARCTRADGRHVYVNLDQVLCIERVPKHNRTILSLTTRLLNGELSLEVQEEPQSLIPLIPMQ